MNFKLNALVAAALLAAAGSANAAIDPGLNGNGEIWFAVYDTVAQKSFTFDTGVYMNDFVGTGVNYNYNFASDANWTTFAAGANSANWLWMVGAEGATGTSAAASLRPITQPLFLFPKQARRTWLPMVRFIPTPRSPALTTLPIFPRSSLQAIQVTSAIPL